MADETPKVDPKIEKEIRSIARQCRGPAIFPEEQRIARLKEFQEGDADVRAKLLEEFGLKPSDDPETNFRNLARLVDIRSGCGYDFNETILANPLDGKVREYECPKCKVKGEYRAPIFPADEDKSAA